MDKNETNRQEQIEIQLSEALEKGQMKRIAPEEAARKRLTPRYEIRIQTEMDPIVKETEIVRSMAKEIDDRYDRYLKRIPPHKKEDAES